MRVTDLRKQVALLLHGHDHSLFYAALQLTAVFYAVGHYVLAMWRISYSILMRSFAASDHTYRDSSKQHCFEADKI